LGLPQGKGSGGLAAGLQGVGRILFVERLRVDMEPPRVAVAPQPQRNDEVHDQPAEASPAKEISPTYVGDGRLLAVLTTTMFVVVTNTFMVAPLLVDLAAEFRTSVGAMGQLAAAAALPWAILAPFMGVLSDRYGRRPVLSAGLAFLAVSTLICSRAPDYSTLLLFRVLGGIGGATTGPNVMAAAAEYFPPQHRGRALGLVVAGISMSTVAGVPLAATAAAYLGWRWAFAAVGLLVLCLAVAVWTTLPRAKPRSVPSGYISGILSALAYKSTPPLLVANVLERASFTTVSTYLAAFLMQSYSLRLEQVAPALSVIALGTVVGSLFGGRLADRGNQLGKFITLQLVAAALAAPVFTTSPGVVATALLAALFGVANSLARPAWMWMANRVPDSRRGATMGFAATTNQLGLMVGAALGGALVGHGSYSPLGLLVVGGSVGAAAICALFTSRE